MNGQIVSKIVSKKKSKKDLICSSCPTHSLLTAYVCKYVCARGWWVCVLLVLLLLGKIGCCFLVHKLLVWVSARFSVSELA